MALFQRGNRDAPQSDETETEVEAVETPVSEAPASDDAATEESVPHVNISVSTYGKPAPRPTPPAPPKAPENPQMPPNELLRSALKDIPARPEPLQLFGVMRQALQGHLYLRVAGNVQELMAAKQPITLAVSTMGDKRYLLAYTGVDMLRESVAADGDTNTSAIAQPVMVVFANALQAGHDGVILDPTNEGGRIILPIDLIAKSIQEADPEHTLKTLLSGARTPETPAAVVDALTRVKVWVAGRKLEEGVGMAEARTATGERLLEIYSHPLEVLGTGRNDQPLPLEPAQLGAVLATQTGLDGVVIDPAGPWMGIDRERLAPVLALATT